MAKKDIIPEGKLGDPPEQILHGTTDPHDVRPRGTIASMEGIPHPGEQLGRGDPPADPARYLSSEGVFRPTTFHEDELSTAHGEPHPERQPPPVDVLLKSLPPGYTPRELEQLAAGILKLSGRAGKTPTGAHVARHGFMRDPIGREEKPFRVAPGTRLADLSPEEIAHLLAQNAIEPEYA